MIRVNVRASTLLAEKPSSKELDMAPDSGTNHPADRPDSVGEQWHGAHSDPKELREPRREPGGVQRTVESDSGGDPRP